MRATTIHAPGDIRLTDVPDPTIEAPTDAIVRVVAGCICGSDLWPYRGANPITADSTIGHEAVGVVEEIGSEVSRIRKGDFVVIPFVHCDNTCPHCLAGMTSVCDHQGWTESGQAELVRVNQADGSLVATDGLPDDALLPSLLSLADVMATGWHAAVSSRVEPGGTAVVIGDGAVGRVGAPHGVELPVRQMFVRNVGLAGGMAPVRTYLPDLLSRVLDGRIDPGRVFDLTLPLDEVAEGYRAMDERRAIKVLLRP